MKRAFLTFALALMLTVSLAACTTTPSDTGNATGNGNGSVTQDDTANNGRARGSDVMRRNGQYYADDNGNVYGGDGTGSDIRRATDDMMGGMGNAVNDMTH